jgi:hypothetical protein
MISLLVLLPSYQAGQLAPTPHVRNIYTVCTGLLYRNYFCFCSTHPPPIRGHLKLASRYRRSLLVKVSEPNQDHLHLSDEQVVS